MNVVSAVVIKAKMVTVKSLDIARRRVLSPPLGATNQEHFIAPDSPYPLDLEFYVLEPLPFLVKSKQTQETRNLPYHLNYLPGLSSEEFRISQKVCHYFFE